MDNGRPLRVLHIIDGLCGGGSERLLWDTVRLSVPTDFQHQVCSVYGDFGRFRYAQPLGQEGALSSSHIPHWMERLGLKAPNLVRRLLVRLCDKFGHPLFLLRLLREYRRFRPDVVHGHIFYGFFYGVILRALFGTPFVYTVPALKAQLEDFGGGWLPPLFARLQRWVEVYFTGASVRELLDLGVAPHRVVELRGGIDIDSLEQQPSGPDLRRQIGIPESAPILLSVGRLHPSKGHEFSLEALPGMLKQVPDLHWLLVGEGEQRQQLERRAEELGVTQQVHLLGFLEDPVPAYSCADLYLRTNVFEAENLSSFLAMAKGLPVVGFDTGVETELVSKVGHGALVPNRDASALAETVVNILSLPDKGRELGESGRAYCCSHLDLKNLVATYFRTYGELARNANRTSR